MQLPFKMTNQGGNSDGADIDKTWIILPQTWLGILLLLQSSHGFSTPTTTTKPLILTPSFVTARSRKAAVPEKLSSRTQFSSSLLLSSSDDDNESFSRTVSKVSIVTVKDSDSSEDDDDDKSPAETAAADAATNTINERLLAELQEAEQRERFGARSSAGKKMGLVDGFGRPRKSDEEIKAAIEEARDLNGVNPIVAILGSFFAFAVASGLWVATKELGSWFAMHPPQTEVYFVVRSAQVFRNVVVGLISLASGFFGVTGLGIFLLGVRVAYGVATGELDPTPIKKPTLPGKQADEAAGVNIGNMLDLMTNKKPGRKN